MFWLAFATLFVFGIGGGEIKFYGGSFSDVWGLQDVYWHIFGIFLTCATDKNAKRSRGEIG